MASTTTSNTTGSDDKSSDGQNHESINHGNTPPVVVVVAPAAAAPAAAAPAAAAPASDNDKNENHTLKTVSSQYYLSMMEGLTNVYGFSYHAAHEAIRNVGDNNDMDSIQACIDYILEHGLGVDQGGPITPQQDCPHLQHSVKVIPNDIFTSVFDTPCCYYSTTNTTTTRTTPSTDATTSSKSSLAVSMTTTAIATVGRRKDDDDSTLASGKKMVCPMGENWLCLSCGDIYCSRYINGHGLRHFEESSCSSGCGDDGSTPTTPTPHHSIMVSLSDLSVWCHECGAYLIHENTYLQPILHRLEQIKFPTKTNTTIVK